MERPVEAGRGFTLLDGAAMIIGAAVASLHFSGATPARLTGLGWGLVWGAFAGIAITAAGSALFLARRFIRRLEGYPRRGSALGDLGPPLDSRRSRPLAAIHRPTRRRSLRRRLDHRLVLGRSRRDRLGLESLGSRRPNPRRGRPFVPLDQSRRLGLGRRLAVTVRLRPLIARRRRFIKDGSPNVKALFFRAAPTHESRTTMRPKPRGPRLLDLISLVAGYGLAALLFRAIWRGTLEVPQGIVAALVYAWFGLAMSGPIVLLLDRRSLPKPKPTRRVPRKLRRVSDSEALFQTPEPIPPPPFTRSEQAWIMIGAYCTIMTLVLVPARLGETPLGIVAVLQLLSGFVLFFLDRRRQENDVQTCWTHSAARIVLIGWPFAWMGLILLLKT